MGFQYITFDSEYIASAAWYIYEYLLPEISLMSCAREENSGWGDVPSISLILNHL